MNKIFRFRIYFENIGEPLNKNNKFYYSILGAILSIFESDKKIYDSILSISGLLSSQEGEYFTIISILGNENFNIAITSIIGDKKIVSLDGFKLKITRVDFNLSVFDFSENYDYNQIKSVEINFLSPTYIKKEIDQIDINYFLPVPEVFLLSAVRKYHLLQSLEFDEQEFKKYIKYNFFVSKFDLRTKQINIKGNLKAGVIGNIKYSFIDKAKQNENFNILINSLELANFIGIGTGIKLGLGQTKIIFNK